MNTPTFRALLLCLMLLLSFDRAAAQSCNMVVSGINFGTVNLLSGGTIDSTGSLTVTCSNYETVGLWMRICPNINAGAGGPARQMRNGANTLNFQLYQDAARSVPWGSVEQPQFGAPPPIDFLVPSLTTLAAPATPVYARILGSQQSTVNGLYTSVFSGASTRFNYKSYVLVPPSCSSMTDNPTQVSFTVQANVERACNVSTQNIVFPSRTRLDSPVDSSGGITVNCTLNLPYIISLDGGLTGAVSPTERKMMLNGNSIMYGLFQNEARTVPLGSAAAHILAGTGTGASQWMPVFGRVQSQPTPPPGTYIDRVMATITY